MSKFSALIFLYKLLQITSEPTKLSTFLENKVLQKLKFSKNVKNKKKCAAKRIFFNEKK